MSKQFRMYTLPEDIEHMFDELQKRVGVRIIQETALRPTPVELTSPIRNKSGWFKTDGSVSVRCYLAADSNSDVRMKYYPKVGNWQVDIESEVIEFSGCDYDGRALLVGRFYCQKDILIDDGLWRKSPQFNEWADRVFRIAKSTLRRSSSLSAYLGYKAELWKSNGGRFASAIKANGLPIFDDQ